MSSFPKSIRKKRTRDKLPGLPFPNYGLGERDVPTLCKCVYDGTNFYVDSQTDILTLYHNGSFGRSTLTLRNPLNDLNRNYEHRPYYKKAALNPKTIITSNFKIPKNDAGASNFASDKVLRGVESAFCGNEKRNSRLNEVPSKSAIIIDPVNAVNSRAEIKSLPVEMKLESEEEDRLELFPEEVIFLSFAVGCLTIETLAGESISYESLWKTLVEKNPDFPMLYAVYHYFRCKNWVPKLGHSYGGDYVLYELGPEFYHSLYIVHVLGFSRPKPVWLEICARQRCASHASKFALFCEVVVPSGVVLASPKSIFDLKIHEVPFYRWAPNLA